jgi:hypothetical protein
MAILALDIAAVVFEVFVSNSEYFLNFALISCAEE